MMIPGPVLEEIQSPRRSLEKRLHLGILRVEEAEGVLLEPAPVVGSQTLGMRAQGLAQSGGKGLARRTRWNAVDPRLKADEPEPAEEIEEHPDQLGIAGRRGNADQLRAD